MAENGKEILDQAKVSVDGSSTDALGAFSSYYDILNKYRSRLAACGVDFSSLTEATAAKYTTGYRVEDDVQIRAIRSDGQTLKRSAVDSDAQKNLVAQTKNLGQHWNDGASGQVLETYRKDASWMEADVDHLHDRADSVTQVAISLENILQSKQKNSADAVNDLINSRLHNNMGDFDNRLRTACESMEANNQGGGIGGLGTNQHLYARQGGSGANWSASDVRKDIQGVVVAGFAACCGALDAYNQSTKDAIGNQYHILLQALGVETGEGDVSAAQLRQIMNSQGYQLSEQKAEEYAPLLNDAMKEFGITTPAQQAAFLAQLAHESGGLTLWSENGKSGAGFEQGRGAIQLTHQENYQAAEDRFNIGLMSDPDKANDPRYTFRIAAWFVTSRDMGNALGKLGDGSWGDDDSGFEAMSRVINGGHNGWQSRDDYYNLARKMFGLPPLGPYPQHSGLPTGYGG
jgi:predicted chitinase